MAGLTTPDLVMRTGAYGLFDPLDARANVQSSFVNRWVTNAVGRQTGMPPIRNTPAPVSVGPIKAPTPAAPLPVSNATPSDAQAEQMQGYFGYAFGAEEEAAAAVVAAEEDEAQQLLLGAGVGAGVGLLGGLVVSLLQPRFSRRYLLNSLVGAGAGAGAVTAAHYIAR